MPAIVVILIGQDRLTRVLKGFSFVLSPQKPSLRRARELLAAEILAAAGRRKMMALKKKGRRKKKRTFSWGSLDRAFARFSGCVRIEICKTF